MAGNTRKETIRIQIMNQTESRECFSQDVELLYLFEGELTVIQDTQKSLMREEDILLINAGKKYQLRGENVLYVQLLLSYSAFCETLGSPNVMFFCDSTRESSKSHENLRKLIRGLLKEYLEMERGKPRFAFDAVCSQIQDILSSAFLIRTVSQDLKEGTEKYEERIRRINQYVYANYRQPINIKEPSENLFLSVGYLSRFFKSNYGMNFADYVNKIRLQHSVEELIYTENPITMIAYDNGFSNTTAFNKAFKKEYGDTPTAMRKRYSTEKEEKGGQDTGKLRRQLEEIFGEEEQAPAVPEEDIQTVSAREEGTPTSFFWNKLINVGAAEDLAKSEVREHLLLMKTAFHFEYARFWSPFTREMFIDVNDEEGEYNFSRLNTVMDFLVDEGFKLHIELGTKPRRIQKNSKENLIYEEKESADSLIKWERMLEAFMNNLLQRYSLKTVSEWRFELWWKEDYVWEGNYYPEEYFRSFKSLYRIVKRYSPNSLVGGCGMNTYLPADITYPYMQDFYKKWSRETVAPDFVSLVSYPYILQRSGENLVVSQRSLDADYIKHGLDIVKNLLRECGWEDTRLWIAEWSLSISDRNALHDSCYKGAYILKNCIDLYGEIDVMGYFLGSDRTSEYYDTSQLLYGGNGLLTKDGILKPAGFAFTLLNRSGSHFLRKGKNWLVTGEKPDMLGILCHNCKSLNYNYFSTREDEIDKKNLEKYYEDTEPLELYFRITDVEDGIWQLRFYRINEKHGSILNLWSDMEYEKKLSREDIRYFRRVCEPMMQIQKKTAIHGKLDVRLRLLANEILFVSLKRKSDSLM
ncbi:MAG: helix-turn-helix domain-containing protein [Clostridiales bacterium]|nr:helix-turn-helix domain-containing protein [Clostridiales bacterium]